MKTITEHKEKILTYLVEQAKCESLRSIARRTGLNHSSLSRIVRDSSVNPSYETLEVLEKDMANTTKGGNACQRKQ